MASRFSFVKKGYNPEEVDSYIQGIEAALKSYKEKEIAIKNALINAQLAADNVVRVAEEDVKKMKGDAFFQLESVRNSILDQKKLLEDFQSDYKRMTKKYMVDVVDTDFVSLRKKIDELADTMVPPNEQTREEKRLEMSETKVYEAAATPMPTQTPSIAPIAPQQSSSTSDDDFRELLK